jgi:hypothetical protein
LVSGLILGAFCTIFEPDALNRDLGAKCGPKT